MVDEGKRTGLQSMKKIANLEHTNVIKKEDLQPGECVSTDQYGCRVKGRLPYTKGKEDPHKMYCGGTLFIDHTSGYVSIFTRVYLGAADTVRSKETYDRFSE